MAATNANGVAIPDGHAVRVSRFGLSDSYHRKIYQSDGSTLIVSVAAGAAAEVTYQASTGLWYQSG
jgi:hypothetical protein